MAISALLAVTTDLPDFSAVSIADSAGSPAPPINSTKQSMPGSLASASAFLAQAMPRRSRPRFFAFERAVTATTRNAAPAARRQRAGLALDEADHFGAHGAEPRNTHFQGCDHDAK